jgi:streptomycin 6-kinase
MTFDEIDLSIFGNLQGRWNISSAFLIADTKTSRIYRITQIDGTSAIIKALKPDGARERIGAHYLQWANGNGAVRLIDHSEDHFLLADAGEMTLAEFWTIRGEECATDRIVDVIDKLHGNSNDANIDLSQLTPLTQHFEALLQPSMTAPSEAKAALAFARELASLLLDDQSEAIPLHGDLHHDNILFSETYGWVAIDPQGLFGDPIYDCANVFGNPNGPIEQIVNGPRAHYLSTRFAALFRSEPSHVLRYAIAHAGLSLSWHLEDKSRIENGSDAAQRLAFIHLGQDLLAEGL